METLENFRIDFLFYLPVCLPAYLIGSLTYDYFFIYQPEKIPVFMRDCNITREQVQAKNGDIIPLLRVRVLTAIAQLTGGVLLSAICDSFSSFQGF